MSGKTGDGSAAMAIDRRVARTRTALYDALVRLIRVKDYDLITVEDVEISETETRTQAAVALLVDTSFSMVMENRWLPMKRKSRPPRRLAVNRRRCVAR